MPTMFHQKSLTIINCEMSGKCREDGIGDEEDDDLPIHEPEEKNGWPWNRDGYGEGLPEQPKLSMGLF